MHVRVFTVHRIIHAPHRYRSWIARGAVALALAIALVSAFGYQVHTNQFPAATATVDTQTDVDVSPVGPPNLCKVNFGPDAYGVDRKASPSKRATDYAKCMKAYRDDTFYQVYDGLIWVGIVDDHPGCTGINSPVSMTIWCADGFTQNY